jgi:hypothetical protein
MVPMLLMVIVAPRRAISLKHHSDTGLTTCSLRLLTSPDGDAIYPHMLSNKVKNYD